VSKLQTETAHGRVAVIPGGLRFDEGAKKVTTEINVLALVKGNERYVFLFDDENRTETLRQIGRYAANPDLSFSWYDAAVMSQKIRQTVQAAEEKEHDLDLSSRFRLPFRGDNTVDWFDSEEEAA